MTNIDLKTAKKRRNDPQIIHFEVPCCNLLSSMVRKAACFFERIKCPGTWHAKLKGLILLWACRSLGRETWWNLSWWANRTESIQEICEFSLGVSWGEDEVGIPYSGQPHIHCNSCKQGFNFICGLTGIEPLPVKWRGTTGTTNVVHGSYLREVPMYINLVNHR